jgi:hypothetical protein
MSATSLEVERAGALDNHDERAGWVDAIVVIVLAGVAFVATLIGTRHGLSITSDSVTYLGAAERLAHGVGYSDYTHQTVTHWPPGYSFLISLGVRVGWSASSAARLLNASAFAALVPLSYVLAASCGVRRWPRLAVALVVACGAPLLLLASAALSEIVFCTLAIAVLIVFARGMRHSSFSALSIALAGAFAGAASLVRIAGIALVMFGAVVVIVWNRKPPRRTLTGTVLYLVFAALPFAAWSLWNLTTGGGTGQEVAGVPNLGHVLSDEIHGLATWFGPNRIPDSLRVLVLALAAGFVLVMTVRTLRHSTATHRAQLALLAGFVVCYFVFVLVASAAGSDTDQRILVPIYVPLVILLTIAVQELAQLASVRYGPQSRTVLAVVVALCLVGVVAWFVSVLHTESGQARGYLAARWQSSPTLRAFERSTLPERAVVLSNRPAAVAFVTGREPVKVVPDDLGVEPGQSTDGLRTFVRDHLCRTPQVLVWIDDPHDVHPTTVFSDLVALQRIGDGRDGAIYQMTARDPSTACTGSRT